MDLKERAKRLWADIPAVFLAMRKRETPLLAKILAAVVVAYALSPIDLIPDFIPVLGLLDDVILLPALIALMVKMIPAQVFTECRTETEGVWSNGKPRKWYYALPVVLTWGLLLFVIVKAIWL